MSDMSAIESVQTFIQAEIAPSRNVELTNSTNLIESGIIDSLGVMKMIAFVEQEYSVTLNPDDLVPENFETLDAITALLNRYIKS
jgi:acyl carrier protein